MSERTSDWNALFDPATPAAELERIAAEHPEFAAQAQTHANWPAPIPPSPPEEPSAFPFPIPAHEVDVVADARRPARLTAGERTWWVAAAGVWVLAFAVFGVLRELGLLDELVLGGAVGTDDMMLRVSLWTVAVEAAAFVVAILAAVIAGRTAARRLGGLIVLLAGLAAVAAVGWFTPSLVLTILFSWTVTGVDAPWAYDLLPAIVTAVPIAIEVLAGAMAYALSVERRWRVLWVAPIALVLTMASYYLAAPLSDGLGTLGAVWVVLGIGVLIRLIVVVLAAVLGARRELTHPYAAPAYEPPAY